MQAKTLKMWALLTRICIYGTWRGSLHRSRASRTQSSHKIVHPKSERSPAQRSSGCLCREAFARPRLHPLGSAWSQQKRPTTFVWAPLASWPTGPSLPQIGDVRPTMMVGRHSFAQAVPVCALISRLCSRCSYGAKKTPMMSFEFACEMTAECHAGWPGRSDRD